MLKIKRSWSVFLRDKIRAYPVYLSGEIAHLSGCFLLSMQLKIIFLPTGAFICAIYLTRNAPFLFTVKFPLSLQGSSLSSCPLRTKHSLLYSPCTLLLFWLFTPLLLPFQKQMLRSACWVSGLLEGKKCTAFAIRRHVYWKEERGLPEKGKRKVLSLGEKNWGVMGWSGWRHLDQKLTFFVLCHHCEHGHEFPGTLRNVSKVSGFLRWCGRKVKI